MQLDSIEATAATVWVSAVCTAGIAGSVGRRATNRSQEAAQVVHVPTERLGGRA